MKNKRIRNWSILVFILLIVLITPTVFLLTRDTGELKKVKSDKELERIYKGETGEAKEILVRILGMPFTPFVLSTSNKNLEYDIPSLNGSVGSSSVDSYTTQSKESSVGLNSNSKDYSTTNIQVENVDEADITKTDGDYIYSISEDTVVITDVRNPEEIKVAAKISLTEGSLPEDLILYDNKLVVVSEDAEGTSSYYSSSDNTIVSIYDITDREVPRLLKHYTLYEPYYTSRCIDNKLYVISSGNLRKENDKIVTYYTEDYEQKEIGFDHIEYLKDVTTTSQTLISMMDLNQIDQNVHINSYLMDISNAYVSENNIYLLDARYSHGRLQCASDFHTIWPLGSNRTI